MTPQNEDEAQLREALMAVELLNSQLDAIAREQEMLQINLIEHEKAKSTLDAIKEQNEGNEILVPIGADTYITCSIQNTKNSQINIGAGVSMEKSIPDSITLIEERIEKIHETNKKLNEVANNYKQQLEAITQRAQTIQSQMSQE